MITSPSSFAALVLAAGMSTRMGAFKPLLEVGGATLVARAVALFKAAGVADIRVVAGFQAERVVAQAQKAGAGTVVNADYQNGMLSSVQAGLAAIDGVKAVFVLPVDVGLVRPGTLSALMDRFAGGAVVYPVFRGRRGHPPLIDSGLLAQIVSWKGPGGLDTVLAAHEDRAIEVAVADEAICLDMDTEADFAAISALAGRRHVPSTSEAMYLLETVSAVDAKIIAHGKAVAQAALGLALALNRSGCRLDLDLVHSAGLVHDIARQRPDHARAGAEFLAGLGFAQVADIVAVHMEITPRSEGVDEAEVVHLADKLVRGDRQVDLDTRFGAKLEKYGHDPEAVRRIRRRLAAALAIAAKMERITGMPIGQILHPNPSRRAGGLESA